MGEHFFLYQCTSCATDVIIKGPLNLCSHFNLILKKTPISYGGTFISPIGRGGSTQRARGFHAKRVPPPPPTRRLAFELPTVPVPNLDKHNQSETHTHAQHPPVSSYQSISSGVTSTNGNVDQTVKSWSSITSETSNPVWSGAWNGNNDSQPSDIPINWGPPSDPEQEANMKLIESITKTLDNK